jgi:hypothetical protein
MGRAQLEGGPMPETLNISGSPIAGLVGGVVGTVMGTRTAFWLGAVLGAAGMDRFDAILLRRVGIDMDAFVAKANEAAQAAAGEAVGAAEQKVAEMQGAATDAAAEAGSAAESATGTGSTNKSAPEEAR